MSDNAASKSTLPILIAAIVAIVVAIGAGAMFLTGKEEKNTNTAGITATIQDGSAQVEASAGQQDPNDPTVASVDGKPIKQTDVERFLATQSFNPRQDINKIFPLALEQVIRGQVVINEAEKAGLESDPEVQAQMEAARRHIINTVFLQRTVDTKITDAKLKKAYDEYVKTLPDVEERRARHILLKTEEDAKTVIEKIAKGAKFEDVARESSIGPTGPNGGDLGWFTKDRMVPAFGEAAFAMKKGQVSKAPVKSEFGYHVIKMEDKRTKPGFEELKQQLTIQLRQDILNDLIDGWQKQAKVERFIEENLLNRPLVTVNRKTRKGKVTNPDELS